MSRAALIVVALVAACTGARPASPQGGKDGPAEPPELPSEWLDPAAFAPVGKPSREREPRPDPTPVVIRHATILTAAGKRIDDGAIVLERGKISVIGDADLPAPPGAREVDARGRFVTPGIIDTHSHIGVYRAPSTAAYDDGNEATDIATPQAAAAYAYDAQDPQITRAMAGGVTAAQILPGSANLIGGRGLVVEMRPGRAADEVLFPGSRPSLKMACGENPKRNHAGKVSTRMGEYAAFRAAFQAAAEYLRGQRTYEAQYRLWLERKTRAEMMEKQPPGESAPTPPPVDAKLEVLAAVLRGEILVQVHCYTQGDILQMIAIADEFGFQVRSFHHALEAYKVRDRVVAHGASISTWSDWWGFKMEAFDGIPENAALFLEAGGRACIHSDSAIGIQRLNQEAAKAMHAGRAAGIDVSEDQALRWITANPAWTLGIDDQTGTLEVGKRADVVIWSAHPFSVYALADEVFIAGEPVYQRSAGLPATDFEVKP